MIPLYKAYALRTIEGSSVLWTCKTSGAQHMINFVWKIRDFLLAQEQKLGAMGTALRMILKVVNLFQIFGA